MQTAFALFIVFTVIKGAINDRLCLLTVYFGRPIPCAEIICLPPGLPPLLGWGAQGGGLGTSTTDCVREAARGGGRGTAEARSSPQRLVLATLPPARVLPG